MSSGIAFQELLPMADGPTAANPHRDGTGVISYQGLRHLLTAKEVVSGVEFDADQLQPASVDLRLGRRAWRVRASFLPGVFNLVVLSISEA